MTDYPKLAPIVHEAFAAFEAETSAAQQRMEEEYLALKATSEAAARSHLDAFNLKVIAEAEALAEKLSADSSRSARLILRRLFLQRTARTRINSSFVSLPADVVCRQDFRAAKAALLMA